MAAPSYLHGPLSVHQQLDGLSCVRNLCREAMPPPWQHTIQNVLVPGRCMTLKSTVIRL